MMEVARPGWRQLVAGCSAAFLLASCSSSVPNEAPAPHTSNTVIAGGDDPAYWTHSDDIPSCFPDWPALPKVDTLVTTPEISITKGSDGMVNQDPGPLNQIENGVLWGSAVKIISGEEASSGVIIRSTADETLVATVGHAITDGSLGDITVTDTAGHSSKAIAACGTWAYGPEIINATGEAMPMQFNTLDVAIIRVHHIGTSAVHLATSPMRRGEHGIAYVNFQTNRSYDDPAIYNGIGIYHSSQYTDVYFNGVASGRDCTAYGPNTDEATSECASLPGASGGDLVRRSTFGPPELIGLHTSSVRGSLKAGGVGNRLDNNALQEDYGIYLNVPSGKQGTWPTASTATNAYVVAAAVQRFDARFPLTPANR